MNKLIQLLADKAKIEGKIRQHRVVVIRQMFATVRDLDKIANQLVDEMEHRLAQVVYCQSEFDDLLEQVETKFGLN